MIVVAVEHSPQRNVVLMKRRGVGRSPPIRDVGHDQHTEAVGPVEFAWRLDLHVLTQPVQTDLASPQNLVTQNAVGGKRVKATGMIRLIERELQEHRSPVDRDVRVCRARDIDDRDRAKAEIRAHPILNQAFSCNAHRHFMQEWIIERPAMGIRQRNLEVRGRRASCDVAREHRLAVPIGESDAERQRAGSRF